MVQPHVHAIKSYSRFPKPQKSRVTGAAGFSSATTLDYVFSPIVSCPETVRTPWVFGRLLPLPGWSIGFFATCIAERGEITQVPSGRALVCGQKYQKPCTPSNIEGCSSKLAPLWGTQDLLWVLVVSFKQGCVIVDLRWVSLAYWHEPKL